METEQEEPHLKYSKYLPQYNFDCVSEDIICSIIDATKCTICLMIMAYPVTLHCGHSFCKSCIYQCSRCPLCKSTFNKKLPKKNIILSSIIELQKVVCPANLNDPSLPCKATDLTIKNIESHVKECGYILLRCKCGVSIPRNLFLKSDSNCLCRLIVCKFCSKFYLERIISLHSDICKKKEVLCESCGTKYLQENKGKHLEEECFVSCPFQIIGCLAEINKEFLSHHLKETVFLHGNLGLRRQFPGLFSGGASMTKAIRTKIADLCMNSAKLGLSKFYFEKTLNYFVINQMNIELCSFT